MADTEETQQAWEAQFAEIKTWAARFSVNPANHTTSRYELAEILREEDDKIAVFQHTKDDYEFLIAATERANKRVERLEGGYDWADRIANLKFLLSVERGEVRRLRALLDADKEGGK